MTTHIVPGRRRNVLVPAYMARLFDRVKTQSHSDTAALTEQVRQLQAALSRLRTSKVKAYQTYRDGTLGRDGYTDQKAEIDRQVAEAEAQIVGLEATLERCRQEKNRPWSGLEPFRQYEEVPQGSKELVDGLVSSIYVYGSQAIKLVWNHRDEYMKLARYPEKKCGQTD